MGRARRWLLRITLGLGLLAVLLGFAFGLVSATAWGRARVLALGLERVNAAIPGTLQIRSLTRLSPFGIELSDLGLTDPEQQRVLDIGSVRAEWAPLELLRGRIVIRSLELSAAHVDLRESGARRGVLGALIDPEAAQPQPGDAPPPYLRVDVLRARGATIRAPELPELGQIDLRELSLTASLELDRGPTLEVTALSFEMFRAEQLLGGVGPLTARLERPGQASRVQLEARLAGARVELTAHGLPTSGFGFPGKPGRRSAIVLDGLSSQGVALLLGDPSLERAFAGRWRLDLTASGSLNQLSIQSTVHTPGGPVELRLREQNLRQITFELLAKDLILSKLRADLPERPVTLRLDSSADITQPDHVPLRLRVTSAALGDLALPELDAEAVWHATGLGALRASARRGQSRLDVDGEIGLDGSCELGIQLAVLDPELIELARASGSRQRPKGGVNADLRLSRTAAGELRVKGNAAVRQLSVAQLELARADVEVDVAGPPLELAGRVNAKLRGLDWAGSKLDQAEIHVVGAARDFSLQAKAQADQLRAELDLQVDVLKNGARIRGTAAGQLETIAFGLDVSPTSIDSSGAIQTAGIRLHAGGQAISAVGGFGKSDSELVLTARDVSLEHLSRLGLGLPELSGRGELTARLSGTPSQPRVHLQLEARQISRADSPPLDATLESRLDAASGRLSVLAKVTSDTGSTPAALDAELNLSSEFAGGAGWLSRIEHAQNHLELNVQRLDVALLPAWIGQASALTGGVSLQLQLDGPLTDPALHMQLRGHLMPPLSERGVELAHSLDYSAGDLATQLTLSDALGTWLNLDAELSLPAQARRDLVGIVAEAKTLLAQADWQLSLELERRRLDQLAFVKLPALGNLDFDGALSVSHAPDAEPTARARLRLGQSSAIAPLAGCSDAGVELSLNAELGSGRLKADLIGTHRKTELLRSVSEVDVQLAAALRGEGLSFGAIQSKLSSRNLNLQSLPFLCQRLRGTLDGTVEVLDPLGQQPTLEASLAATGLSLGAEPALDLSLRARADRDDVALDVGIRAPAGHATLRAELPIDWSRGKLKIAPNAPVSARASLTSLPIAPFLDPGGAVSHAAGTVSGQVSVEGPLDDPHPSGHLELQNAELTATALAQPLHGVSGRFDFSPTHLDITRFEARDRDGVLELNGRVNIPSKAELNAKLNVVAKDFPLRQQGQVVATTSGHATVVAKISPTRTDVSLELVDADTWLEKAQVRVGMKLSPHSDFVIDGKRPDAPATLAAPGNPKATAAQATHGEPSGRTSVLALDATDHFWVKREDFAIQLSTHLVAHMDENQTRVMGRVDVHRGYLDLMGRVFEIQRGSHLEFTGSNAADPVVAIEASHERRGSGKIVKVKISGRGSRPELSFFVDELEVSAGEALEELVGRRGADTEQSAKSDAASFVSGLTAGLLATSARRELGAAAPIIMIEPGDQTGDGRLRAGFELDSLIPDALASVITGVYLEGIVAKEGAGQESSTQAGVLVELYFPNQLFSTGQWGPGTTWSLDWGWAL